MQHAAAHVPGASELKVVDPPPILPGIIAPQTTRARVSLPARGLAACIALSCLTVLVIASLLPPSRRGFSTHTQLGLQPCQFLSRTGLPCAGCGMTTSFAWFARGNIVASFYVQPMGTVLATLAGMAFWGGGYVAITGRPAYRILWLVPSRYYVMPLLYFGALAWAWKISIHIRGLDGW